MIHTEYLAIHHFQSEDDHELQGKEFILLGINDNNSVQSPAMKC